MGSKTILFLGVIASTAYLYFAVNNQPSIDDAKKQSDIPTLQETVTNDEVINNKGERLSIPAFGFILIKESKQIAAVMSDEDKNGELAQYIDKLCEEQECIKDIKYNSDTKSANWQKETIGIIKLLTDGSINNGSIFIDGNTLKITGNINNQNKKQALDKILENTKIEIEDKTTFVSKTEIKEFIPKQPTIKKEVKTTISKPIKKNSMLDADARVRAILEEFKKNK
jgi:hypothetical protein